MLSKRLQIIITLMFVTMMFVQTPAIASNSAVLINNGSNSNSTDYQSDNQFSPGNTAGANTNLGKSNLNGNAQVSSLNANVIGYNYSGTIIGTNSSYVHPKQSLEVIVNTSQINNLQYNNSFAYDVVNQYGQTIYPETNGIPLKNLDTTNTTPTNFQSNWSEGNQSLNGQIAYNSTSISQLYAVSTSSVVNASISSTIEQITWQSNGNSTSSVGYKTLTSSTWTNFSVSVFTSFHNISLVQLLPNTTYEFQVSGYSFGIGKSYYSPIYSFTTVLGTTGVPYVSSPISYTTQIDSGTGYGELSFNNFTTTLNSNIWVYYSDNRSTVNSQSPVPFDLGLKSFQFNIIKSNLLPGHEYFFKMVVQNATNTNLNSTYNNNGLYYSFIIPVIPNTFQIPYFHLSHIDPTTSQVNITFTTLLNATTFIEYSLDPNFLPGMTVKTSPDSLNTTHSFTLNNMFGATKYFVRIIAGNNTVGFTNFIYTTTSNNTALSFITASTPNQDIEKSFFTIILQMPTYPAVLGNYLFRFYINQTQLLPPYSITSNRLLGAVTFIVNDTLQFNVQETLVQRGSFTNSTGTYPIWVNSKNSVYSPTDVVSFIGNLSYSSAPNNPINNSFWTTNYVPTGKINLYANNQKILTGSSNSLFNIFHSPLNVSESFYSGLDPNTYMILNVTVPAIDIYGSISVELGYNIPNPFPQTTTLANTTQLNLGSYINIQNLTVPLNVQYRLMESSMSGKPYYSLTTTNFVGSATVIPYQYENITNEYPQSYIQSYLQNVSYDSYTNISNIINLPGQNIHLNLSVTLNGAQQNIFEFTRLNYTWKWHRESLDSSLQQGNYTIKLLWTGLDGSNRSFVAKDGTVYSNDKANEFSYQFTLSVSFTISDLTANLTVLPNTNANLRFKVVVPSTGIAWDKDLHITTTNGVSCTFDNVTGEYHLVVKAPSLSGSSNQEIQTIKLQASVSFANNTIVYTVAKNLVTSTQSQAGPIITQSTVHVHISLIGFGYIGLAVVATVVYAAIIFYFVRKRS